MRTLVVLFGVTFATATFAGDPEYIRGDSDQNGAFSGILDSIHIIEYLIGDGDDPLCFDASDANDDGRVNILDIMRILYFVFGDADELPGPFPDCGTDETTDDLDCADPEGCP